ncbi:MAG: hypothetical protein GF363_17315 [Chitinivibrionales bacterium]|nr:hypothetical protein [Chitinivibrionales bacterium]
MAGIYRDANGCGFLPFDTLITVNGHEVYADNPWADLQTITVSRAGTPFTAMAKRDAKIITVKGKTFRHFLRHRMAVKEEITPTQHMLRKTWIEK